VYNPETLFFFSGAGMISKLQKWVWLGAAALAFSSGMINVVALLGFAHKAATHMTGIVSVFSIALSKNDTPAIFETFLILLSFFCGAFISGIIIRDGHLKMGRRYGFALAVESGLLFLAAYGFAKNSIWGEYLACAAAGLQNALASTYSGTIVRTTHLTGILTDLGALTGNKIHGLPVDTKRFKLLSIILISFVVGGYLGSLAYARWNAWAMLIPAITIAFSAVGYELFRRNLKSNAP
jgi:uncharacterized membrane protein YoaK (UPF0700 family)